MRNPEDADEWGIFYNSTASPERRRFTIAHELGHFVLHRNRQQRFSCDKESIYSGIDTIRDIEREADDFASNLLMPGDLLREWISKQRIDLRVLSAIAKRFQVSFEALCIRFIEFTPERAILICWDNGFAKYVCHSQSARKSRVNIRRMSDPVEPPSDTLAADASIVQEWEGVDSPPRAGALGKRSTCACASSSTATVPASVFSRCSCWKAQNHALGIGRGRTKKASTALINLSTTVSIPSDRADQEANDGNF